MLFARAPHELSRRLPRSAPHRVEPRARARRRLGSAAVGCCSAAAVGYGFAAAGVVVVVVAAAGVVVVVVALASFVTVGLVTSVAL